MKMVDFQAAGALQNAKSFADAKLALRAHVEVIRRDGLSSWRVIFFVAAGMLSGKSAANYMANFGRKSMISHART